MSELYSHVTERTWTDVTSTATATWVTSHVVSIQRRPTANSRYFSITAMLIDVNNSNATTYWIYCQRIYDFTTRKTVLMNEKLGCYDVVIYTNRDWLIDSSY